MSQQKRHYLQLLDQVKNLTNLVDQENPILNTSLSYAIIIQSGTRLIGQKWNKKFEIQEDSFDE